MRSADDQGEGLLLNSYDRTLVIKQISSEDVADMHNILSEYHQVRSGFTHSFTHSFTEGVELYHTHSGLLH